MTYKPDFIPVARPWITEREGDLAKDAALNAWGPDHYKFNKIFETNFAEYIGCKHAVSLPHATAALHLILVALGIGPGDEVIVPDVTWIASAAPISYVGATPVFIDICNDTWCIDPDEVEAAITPKTKAIIGVDLYGSMCDWTRLKEIADRHNLYLIEDAAEALGSEFNGKKAGSFGNASAFSFHGSKTLVTGEGGMLVTDDDQLFERVLSLRDHGRPVGDRAFQNSEIAFKYKMSAMQAAVGLAQLERIDQLVDYKREIFSLYRERLSNVDGLQLNSEPENTRNSFWMTTIVQTGERAIDKFELQEKLRADNIDTRPFFSQLSKIKAYEHHDLSKRFLREQSNGVTAANFGINLPSGFGLDEQMIDYICQRLLVHIDQ